MSRQVTLRDLTGDTTILPQCRSVQISIPACLRPALNLEPASCTFGAMEGADTYCARTLLLDWGSLVVSRISGRGTW